MWQSLKYWHSFCHYIPSISELNHNVIMNTHLLSEGETFPLLNWSEVGRSLYLVTHVSRRANRAAVDCSRALARHHRVEDVILGMFRHHNPTLASPRELRGSPALIEVNVSSRHCYKAALQKFGCSLWKLWQTKSSWDTSVKPDLKGKPHLLLGDTGSWGTKSSLTLLHL